MKDAKGFSLVELLIVVAIIAIIAAIAIPNLMRARVAANEAATLGDIRTVISAEAAYQSANHGFFDASLSCLTDPRNGACIPNYPTVAPTFLDSQLAAQQHKSGYNRTFEGGPLIAPRDPTASATSTGTYRYDATPTNVGQTGVRGFAADSSGRICFTVDGVPVIAGPPGALPGTCVDLR